MNSAITKYKEMIPQEARAMIEALSEPSRQGLAVMLAEKGELSFKEILLQAKPMNSSTLTHHLKILIKAGLVENHYRKIEGKDDYSFYQLTSLGKQFLRQLGAT